MVEDQPTRPISPYGASKSATETYALAYTASFGLPVLAFRLFNVFGRLQPADHVYAAVIPKFIDAALAGRPLEVHGDGLQTRDFTYVDSVVAVVRDAIARRVTSPKPVNLAFGGRSTLLEVIAILEQLLGHDVAREHTAPRAGDIHDSQADPTTLRSLFPDLTPVPLEDGLAATLAWFQAGADPRLGA
jgi:UDP-glucose 4-epimerase